MPVSPARTSALSPAALVDAEHLRADVDAAVTAHLDRLTAEVGAISPSAEAMVEEAAGLLMGGKRLRSAFCYWSFRAHGGSADPADPARTATVRVGAALELFQAAALLHDDVMDNSDTRRGRPTAHRAFAARHASAAWAGEPVRFGDSAAILIGDLVLLAAQRELSAALEALPAPVAAATRARFDAMQSEVVVGQYLDVLVQAEPWGQDPAADEERARDVLRAKTASYSVAAPLALGALLAGHALGLTGFALHHVISQTIVRTTGAPHSAANAVMLPHVARFMEARAPRELALFNEAVDLERLSRAADTNGLGALGVERDELPAIVKATAARRGDLAATPGDAITTGELRALLDAAY